MSILHNKLNNQFNKGAQLQESGQLDSALESFQELLQLDPNFIPALRKIGELHMQRQELNEAMVSYQKLIEKQPQDASAYLQLGRALIKQKRFQEALYTYQEALRLQRSELNEVIASYQKLIEKQPQDASAYLQLGRALIKQKRFRGALYAYQKAIDLKPEQSIQVYEELLNLCQNIWKQEQAPFWTWTMGSIASFNLGNIHEGYVLAQEASKKFTYNFQVQSFLVNWQLRLGKWSQAVTQVQYMMETFPNTSIPTGIQRGYRQAFCNTFGIMKGNRQLNNITHESLILKDKAIQNIDYKSKTWIFISGMPRSGTTALGKLLNLSDDIAIFTELFAPYFSYSPHTFQDRVIKHKLSRTPHQKRNQQIYHKMKSAKFIGDKRPLFQYFMPQSLENFYNNDVFIFHILRSVYDVCLSYQKRSENPDDPWDVFRNQYQCIHEINISNNFICDFLENYRLSNNHNVIFVSYKDIFSNKEYVYSLFRKMSIPITNELQQKIDEFLKSSQGIVSKVRSFRTDIKENINELLDYDAARKVEQLTGVKILEY